jgi:hypothetical protein
MVFSLFTNPFSHLEAALMCFSSSRFELADELRVHVKDKVPIIQSMGSVVTNGRF